MSVKRLHTNSKIFFPNPYVVRVDFGAQCQLDRAESEYRKLTRKAYRNIKGTWGYSNVMSEHVKIKDDHKHSAPPGPGYFTGMHTNLVIAAIMDPDYQSENRAYICFKDEEDALQFRLTVDVPLLHVLMWPERLFMIHEVVEDSSTE